MSQPHDEHYPSLRKVHRGWLGLALPPAAWIAQMGINYALVPFLCRLQQGPLVLLLVSAAALGVAAAGVLLSWREWRSHGGGGWLHAGGEYGDRPRFMALWGMLLGALLLVLIVLQAIPSLVVPPCE